MRMIQICIFMYRRSLQKKSTNISQDISTLALPSTCVIYEFKLYPTILEYGLSNLTHHVTKNHNSKK